MKLRPVKVSGTHGWVLVGAVVVAWELRGPELLSEAVDRALLRGGWVRAATTAGIVLTAAHLLNVCPPFCDPWHHAGKIFARRA